MMKSLSDIQRYGFDAEEIVGFLANHGINIGGDSTSRVGAAREAFPEWKRVMALLPKLTIAEVASAFADIDLRTPGFRSDEEDAELSRWESVIERAIDAGELVADRSANERGGITKEGTILPADLAKWCATKDLAYPLPGGIDLPATESGLRDALARCEQERMQWKGKAEALEGAFEQAERLRTEIDRLREEVRTRTDDVAALSRERDAAKADTLSGRARSTALKIVGGLAMQGYGMAIHAERLDGIAEIVRDLEKVGAAVTEKTLREWIKEAASVIDPPSRGAGLGRKP